MLAPGNPYAGYSLDAAEDAVCVARFNWLVQAEATRLELASELPEGWAPIGLAMASQSCGVVPNRRDATA